MNQQLSPRNYASKSLKPSVPDMDIAHRVQSVSDFGPTPIICKFVRRLAKENVMNHRREVESISPSTLGYSSETS